MHLTNRCRGNRRRVEFSKDRLGIIAELSPDDVTDLLVRDRSHVVEQLEEFLTMGGREQVEPHRQHLPELDPGAAQVFECKPKLDRIEPAMAPWERCEEDAIPDEDGDGLRGA
ncbi:MAG TPA: hypothetical protein VM450_02030 [Thermomicrobiales bacterium]|nr:hypothetical protein [Thermomicrobiales bacterium]